MSPVPCQFRFQHTHPLIDCTIRMRSDQSLEVILDRPLRALTCGQYAVLYEQQVCFGSARITQVGSSLYHKQLSLTQPSSKHCVSVT